MVATRAVECLGSMTPSTDDSTLAALIQNTLGKVGRVVRQDASIFRANDLFIRV